MIEKVLADDERILKDPVWMVAVSKLADSRVNFVVRPWVRLIFAYDAIWLSYNQSLSIFFEVVTSIICFRIFWGIICNAFYNHPLRAH